MKNFFVILVFALLVNATHGQVKDFNLADYKLPVLDRRALELRFDLNGQNIFSNRNIEDYGSDENSSLYLSNNTLMGFSSYKNTQRLQSSQNYSLSLSPRISREVDNDTITDKETNFSTGFSASSINRIYYNNDFFFEPDVFFSTNYSTRETDYESDGTDENYWSSTINLEIPLLIGKGRIEQVQDARLAVYILEELQKTGRLARDPNKEEILEFAALISKVQNKRYFDYRLHRIYEIEQVDSFLQAKSLAAQSDARYFATVYDNWDYSNGPVRESGNRISTGIVPLFYYNRWSYKEQTDHTFVSSGVKLLVNYITAKPLNLHWQRDWEFEVSYAYGKTWQEEKIMDSKSDRNDHELTGIASYNLGFYPNSRTSMETGINLQIVQSFEENNYEMLDDRSRDLGIGSEFHFALNYYVSPQLRVNAGYILSNQYANNNNKLDTPGAEYLYDRSNRLVQSVQVKFTYMIF